MTLNFEVDGKRVEERLKWTWKKQIEKEIIEVGLIVEDALCQSRCIVFCYLVATRLR